MIGDVGALRRQAVRNYSNFRMEVPTVWWRDGSVETGVGGRHVIAMQSQMYDHKWPLSAVGTASLEFRRMFTLPPKVAYKRAIAAMVGDKSRSLLVNANGVNKFR
uniref:Uncharacterized protein n=1 Tax=Vespula pensylvanica TaxID=30213 RepID=A0A834PGH4_VESPE|nr:hypothetical protein H0235_001556 [Vespula pensylvanica]